MCHCCPCLMFFHSSDLVSRHLPTASSKVIWVALRLIASARSLSRSSFGSRPFSTMRRNSALSARASASLRVRVDPSPSSLLFRVVGLVYRNIHERVNCPPLDVTCRYRPVCGPSAWYPTRVSVSTCLADRAFAAVLPTNLPPNMSFILLERNGVD